MRAPARSLQRLTRLAGGVDAYTLAFDDGSLDELRALYEDGVRDYLDPPHNSGLFVGGRHVKVRWEHGGHKFFACSFGKAPLLWVSNDDKGTYEVFRRFFLSLDVDDDLRAIVDVDRNVVVYSGFFVIDEYSPASKWHADNFEGANGLTLIAPLFDLAPTHGHLLYKDADSATCNYRYRRGEAILLGDRFRHTTEPYQRTPARRVLVSLTLGTDKLDYWSVLKGTVADQSEFLILPCGHQRGTCECLREFETRRDEARTLWIANAIASASDERVTVSPHIGCEEAEGETVLVDASGRRCASLDSIGARMWRLIEQHGQLDRVRAAMLAEYSVEPERLDRDLLDFVRSLADAGLVCLGTTVAR